MLVTPEVEERLGEFLEMGSDENRLTHYSIDTIKNFYYLVSSDSVTNRNYSIEWPQKSDIFIEDFARNAGTYNRIGAWILQVDKMNDFAFDAFRNNPEVIECVANTKYSYYRDNIFDTFGHLLTDPRVEDSISDAIRDFIREHSIEDVFLNYEDFTFVHNQELFGVVDEYSSGNMSWNEREALRKKNYEIRRDVVRKAFYKELPESAHINILI